MKIRGSFEQAICSMLIIGTNQEPVKRFELSKRLHVSGSYLKKIIRQLVVHGLITSIVKKTGGFVMGKKPVRLPFLIYLMQWKGKRNLLKIVV